MCKPKTKIFNNILIITNIMFIFYIGYLIGTYNIECYNEWIERNNEKCGVNNWTVRCAASEERTDIFFYRKHRCSRVYLSR